jgi:hypothetical protein
MRHEVLWVGVILVTLMSKHGMKQQLVIEVLFEMHNTTIGNRTNGRVQSKRSQELRDCKKEVCAKGKQTCKGSSVQTSRK